MKYLILALVALSLLTGKAHANQQVNVVCPTNSVTCTVITGSTTSSLSVVEMILSNSTADNFIINCGSTAMVGPLFLGINGGIIAEFKFVQGGSNLVCPANTNLTITKGTSTTPLTVWVSY